MLEFRCGQCGQKIEAPEAYVGKRVRCPRCKQPARVPPPFETPAEAVPPITPPAPDASHGEPDDPWQDVPPEADPESENRFEAEPELEPEPSVVAEFEVSSSEVIDAPVRRRGPALTSDIEVANLFRDLDDSSHPATTITEPSIATEPPREPTRPMTIRPESGQGGVRLLGIMSLLIGLAAIILCWLPPLAKFAVPIGSAGLVLALTGVVFAMGRQGEGLALPIGGATVSAAGIAIALLAACGILPLAGRYSILKAGTTLPVNLTASSPDAAIPADGYVPATSPLIANDVEVRVASALVLQPAVYNGDWSTLHTLPRRLLQITLELTEVGLKPALYRSWRKPTAAGDAPTLTDAAGNPLKLVEDGSNSIPVGGILDPTDLKPHERGCSDVLLFEPPPNPAQDLKLRLSGKNIGAPGTTLRIRIPTTMVRSQ